LWRTKKNERAKWAKILSADKYRALIYVVAIDEFNVTSAEDETMTKLEVSLAAFSALWNEEVQKQTFCIILLLNKIDLFKPKFASSADVFKKKFPAFEGATEEEALQFLTSLFMKKLPPNFQMSSQTLNSLDGGVTQLVFEHIRKFAISTRLKEIGLI